MKLRLSKINPSTMIWDQPFDGKLSSSFNDGDELRSIVPQRVEVEPELKSIFDGVNGLVILRFSVSNDEMILIIRWLSIEIDLKIGSIDKQLQ